MKFFETYLFFLLQHFICIFLPQISQSAEHNSSSYYNQCSQSTCGNSLLQFPFGKDSICRSAYISVLCENHTVFLRDDENPSVKYKLLQTLTKEVYSRTSVRLVDTSLLGCGPIPSFSSLSPTQDNWLEAGYFHHNSRYRISTLFNCSQEPDGESLLNLKRVPCWECGKTSNLCYFYDGNPFDIASCKSFRTMIPIEVFTNLSGVVDLRSVFGKGFVIEWSEKPNICMDKDGGRYGYLNAERKRGEEFCFCKNGIHKNNCSDGVTIDLDGQHNDPQKKPQKRKISLILGTIVGATFLLLSSCYIFYNRRTKLKQNRFSGEDEETLRGHFGGEIITRPASMETFLRNYTLGRPTKFSYKNLKIFTNNFINKIGQGGFGSVFKGQLPNNLPIAVKILAETTDRDETQFLNEVLTLGGIHHSHLVRLLGFCFEKSRRALIYEFVVNGSLDRYIHWEKHGNNDQEPSTSSPQDCVLNFALTWRQLYDIATGTAKGIAYLHEECQSKILHCDIKPHNILLDENFQPKVADFGLALALSRDKSHVSLTQRAGTPGYAPPEIWWMKCGPVTEKSDVYSFGMVLLEMAGMRRNSEFNVSKTSEIYYPEWAFSHHVLNANSCDDKGIGTSGSKWHPCQGKEEEEMAKTMELVGLWCIQFKPSKRPSMRKVVDMLERNVSIQIPSAPFDASISAYGWTTNVPIASQLNSLESVEMSEENEDLHFDSSSPRSV